MPDKVTPLWQVWGDAAEANLDVAAGEPANDFYRGKGVAFGQASDELQATCGRVRERVMALPSGSNLSDRPAMTPTDYADDEFALLIKRDAVLAILRQEGLLDE